MIKKLLGEKLPLISTYYATQTESFDLLEHLIETIFIMTFSMKSQGLLLKHVGNMS